MKKLLSILLAVLMVATLGVVNIMAEGEEEVQSLERLTAALNDENVTSISLANDLEISTTIEVKRSVTINGNGHTITYTGSKKALDILADGVTVKNITIKETTTNEVPVQFYKSRNGVLENVTIVGSSSSNVGLTINASSVTAKGLNLSGNGINIGYGAKINGAESSFDGDFSNVSCIYADVNDLNNVNLNNGKVTFSDSVKNWSSCYIKENFGEYYFDSLKSALDFLTIFATKYGSGASIHITKDLTLESDATISGGAFIFDNVDKTLTLDLNGHKIESNTTAINNLGSLVIADSTGEGKVISTGGVSVGVGDDSTTTIKAGNFESSEGAVITGCAQGATINIEGGTFSASDNAVIMGNGSDRDGERNTINISDGTFNGNIKSSGYIACGIYAPWKDEINVSGGTFNINGGAGIVARAGNVNVSGGIFNITPAASDGWVGDNENSLPSSAFVYDEKAIYPAQTDADKIVVTGGTFNVNTAASVLNKEGSTNSRVVISGGTYNDITDSKFIESGYASYKTEENTYKVMIKPSGISATGLTIPANGDNLDEMIRSCASYTWTDSNNSHTYAEQISYSKESGDSINLVDGKFVLTGKTGDSVIVAAGEGYSTTFVVSVTASVPKAYFDENGLTVVYPADAQKFIDSMIKGVTFDDEITDSGFYNQIYLTYQGDYKMYGGFSNGKYIHNGEVVQTVDVIKANADKTGVTISIEDLVKYGVTDGTYKVEIGNYMGASNVTKINLGTLEITTNKQIDTSEDRVQTLNINIDESAFNFKVGDAVADLNKVAKITDENGNPVKNVSVSWVKDSGIKSPAGETIYCNAKYAYKFAEDGTYDIVDTPNYDADTLYYLYVEYMPNAKKNYANDFKIVLNGKEIEVNKKNTFMGAGAGSVTFRLWESTDYLTIVPVGYAAAKVDYPVGVSEDVIEDKLVSIFIETSGVVNNSKQLEYVSESNTPASNASLKEIVGDGGKLTVALRSASFEETKKDDGSSTVTMSKLVFDVAPVSSDGTVIHGKLSKAITFRLPVDPATTSKYANVYHEGEFLAQYEIKTDADGNKYIEVTNDEFSVYSYELTNTVYSTGSSSDSSSSSNSSSSSSSSSSQTSYKKPVVNTSVK